MAKSEASASGALTNLRTLARDIVEFIRRPLHDERSGGWTRVTFALLAAVIAFDLSIDWMIQAILTITDASLIDLPEVIPVEASLRVQTLQLLILAPIIEEVLFRGWLSGRKASLRFAGWAIIAFAIILFSESDFVGDLWFWPVALALGIVALGFGQWLLTYKSDSHVPAWFTNNFRWFVWGSSITFGLLHLVNYDEITHPLDAVVVLPEILGGLLLAYSRVRFGLRAAIFHHATYNLVFMMSERLG